MIMVRGDQLWSLSLVFPQTEFPFHLTLPFLSLCKFVDWIWRQHDTRQWVATSNVLQESGLSYGCMWIRPQHSQYTTPAIYYRSVEEIRGKVKGAESKDVKWSGRTVCNIKYCFITCLFKMATKTGSTKNIIFHLLRKQLNMLHEPCSSHGHVSDGFALVLKHITKIRQLLESIT